jgi:hypothetical protein
MRYFILHLFQFMEELAKTDDDNMMLHECMTN